MVHKNGFEDAGQTHGRRYNALDKEWHEEETQIGDTGRFEVDDESPNSTEQPVSRSITKYLSLSFVSALFTIFLLKHFFRFISISTGYY